MCVYGSRLFRSRIRVGLVVRSLQRSCDGHGDGGTRLEDYEWRTDTSTSGSRLPTFVPEERLEIDLAVRSAKRSSRARYVPSTHR